MAAADRQYQHAIIIRDTLIAHYASNAEQDGIKSDEIRISDDFDNSRTPSRGIHISAQKEGRGVGLAGSRDVRFICYVFRVMPKTDSTEALQARSKFRTVIYDLFDDTRIMAADAPVCEILTKVNAGDMKLPRQWRESGLDITAMIVKTLIRENN